MKAREKSSDAARDGSGKKARKILLVDDHPILRRGLVELIEQEEDLVVEGEAGSEAEALRFLTKTRVDLAIVDVSLESGSGLELAKTLHGLYPKLPILMLSMHDEALYAERALRAGARGYVMKQESPDTLLRAMRKVLANECYVSEKMTSRMLDDMLRGDKNAEMKGDVERLSDRELEIFERVGRGASTREVAEALHVSVKTVETYYGRIKEKLQARSLNELMQRAVYWIHCVSGKAQ